VCSRAFSRLPRRTVMGGAFSRCLRLLARMLRLTWPYPNIGLTDRAQVGRDRQLDSIPYTNRYPTTLDLASRYLQDALSKCASNCTIRQSFFPLSIGLDPLHQPASNCATRASITPLVFPRLPQPVSVVAGWGSRERSQTGQYPSQHSRRSCISARTWGRLTSVPPFFPGAAVVAKPGTRRPVAPA
jgi:hypothetical protein